MTIIRRKIYGFLSQSTDPYNLDIPWVNSEQDGLFKMNYSLEKAVETNLKAWAKTNHGDRLMRFRFGLDAGRVLFEPENISKEILENNAREQLRQYFGFLNIKELSVQTNEDDKTIPENTVRFTLKVTFKDKEDKKIKIQEDIGI